jgi:hypothetical protein
MAFAKERESLKAAAYALHLLITISVGFILDQCTAATEAKVTKRRCKLRSLGCAPLALFPIWQVNLVKAV